MELFLQLALFKNPFVDNPVGPGYNKSQDHEKDHHNSCRGYNHHNQKSLNGFIIQGKVLGYLKDTHYRPRLPGKDLFMPKWYICLQFFLSAAASGPEDPATSPGNEL